MLGEVVLVSSSVIKSGYYLPALARHFVVPPAHIPWGRELPALAKPDLPASSPRLQRR